MAPKRRCPTCGSRQWHKEPSSGIITCIEGHVLQNYRNETREAEALGPHTLRKRVLKSGRQKKERQSKADPSLYHGIQGRYLYFQCLQLLLRKQITTLGTFWKLPPEFEVVCRDIWALHLNSLPDPPIAEASPLQEALNEETEAVEGDNPHTNSGSGEVGRSMEEQPQEDDTDPELVALLRANSDLEESSEDDENDENNRGAESGQKGIGQTLTRGRRVYESPASTIAVLIVACWTMRIPSLYRDFTRLIEIYELPYLDPIARHLLPGSMVVHLTKHNIQALSPHHSPSAQALHALASRLAKIMSTTYGISTPEANAAPILWRVVSQGLCGTPMLYRLTKRLGHVLSLPLTLHHTLAPGLMKRKTYDPEMHKYDNVAPEVALMGTAIIVLKLVYGLDGRPRDGTDVACGLPRLGDYLARFVKKKSDELSERWDEVLTDDRTMDDYLEFSERALLGKNGRDEDTVFERYFPLDKNIEDVAETAQEEQESNDVLTAILAGNGGLCPGEAYRVYRAQDVEVEMGAEYSVVMEKGARWTGVSVELMGGVVEIFERRLIRWWDDEKRKSRNRDVTI